MFANVNIGKIINLIALLLTALTDHKAPQESTTKSWNYSNKSKIKRTKSRLNYYANYVATFNLALSGDTEINPGPGANACNNAPKCSLCNKGVSKTRKHLQCSQCHNLTHITCSNIPKTEQKHYTAQTVYTWLCIDCTLSTLPFYHSRDLDMSLSDNSDYNVPWSQNKHHQKLNEVCFQCLNFSLWILPHLSLNSGTQILIPVYIFILTLIFICNTCPLL